MSWLTRHASITVEGTSETIGWRERALREQEALINVATTQGIRAQPNPAYITTEGVIHERNDEGKPSATRVNGKPGSVLPKELLVHLQEVKGEEREREVLKTVKAIAAKPKTEDFVFGNVPAGAALTAQALSNMMNQLGPLSV